MVSKRFERVCKRLAKRYLGPPNWGPRWYISWGLIRTGSCEISVKWPFVYVLLYRLDILMPKWFINFNIQMFIHFMQQKDWCVTAWPDIRQGTTSHSQCPLAHLSPFLKTIWAVGMQHLWDPGDSGLWPTDTWTQAIGPRTLGPRPLGPKAGWRVGGVGVY